MKVTRASIVILTVLLVLAGCAAEDSNKRVDGIKVDGAITSNYRDLDEAIVEVVITNETDLAFQGLVTVIDGSNRHWDIEVDLLAPKTSISRQTKTGYIESDKQKLSYMVDGEFIELYESEIDYEILYQPEGTYAFYVQVDEVTKDVAVSVVKDLYSKYGVNLARVAIYDLTLDEEISDENLAAIPKADFYNNRLGYNLTMYHDDGSSEHVDIELP